MTGCDLTHRAQTALRLARESSAQLGHGYVGSEHLLLGLLEERRGAAARALQAAGIQESAVREAIAGERAEMLVIAAATEADIAELESYEERQMFLEDLGLEESGVARLIKSAYKLLNLETFFTTGADETRAWTYLRGMKAPQTAGIIHTDFEKGFIRAEVIKYDDYTALGSEKACRDAGKLSIEGKEYVVEDGDIMHFLFNV